MIDELIEMNLNRCRLVGKGGLFSVDIDAFLARPRF